MFIMDVPPEPINEVPVLITQVDGGAGLKCRNARPRGSCAWFVWCGQG